MSRTHVDARREVASLPARFATVRRASESLAAPLSAEDCAVQSMPDVSPTKWHLAHVSWFFETFLLKPRSPGYRPFDQDFEYLFNSYYNAVGLQYPRPRRGLLTRPALSDVLEYRTHVDRHMEPLLRESSGSDPELAATVELGLNHEQQHQELLLMDIKHVFSCSPLLPAYHRSTKSEPTGAGPAPEWIGHPGGLLEIGHSGDDFCFDNELPRHRTYLEPFRIASRLVTNGEFLDFMADGGYERPELWLADGWTAVREASWRAPLYWIEREGRWNEFTLAGACEIDPAAPVCHVSLFEAAAFAEWAGARLPDEAEWEALAETVPVDGNFVEDGGLHPEAPRGDAARATARQLFGDVWEWTRSAYTPYPGFRRAPGAVGEYNGKFMCNQFVMRGGSCLTPRSHIRPTYRNFFYPHQRWQAGGLRLARDA